MRDLTEKIERDFPVLQEEPHGERLVYLDSAATSLTPEPVLDAVNSFYRSYNANVHRGIHALSEKATRAYESARDKVAEFLGTDSSSLSFTKSTTESINFVARSWGESNISSGDEILLTEMEHHSNIVPWQLLTERRGGELRYISTTDQGTLDLSELEQKINSSTKILALTHVSNVLGTVNPIEDIVARAREISDDITIVVDGAQAVPHIPVDLESLNVDFYAFSGHKMLGPTGVGGLYIHPDIVEDVPPFLGGGEMIKQVQKHAASWKNPPHKYEAGTPNIAQAIGMGRAAEYLQEIGMEVVREKEEDLVNQAYERLDEIEDVNVYGPSNRSGVISFTMSQVHPHDIATIVDRQGVALRAGHHCAQPLMEKLGVSATARASFSFYNRPEDVEDLVSALEQVRELFSREPVSSN